MRDFHLPGRSAVHAMHAMAATSMPEATLAAVDMLRAGGNALDAAITAAAVLSVVEPQSTGIGGDCFCLYKPQGQPVIALNGSGRAPAGLSLGVLDAAGITTLAAGSPHSVTIPGAISAWAALLAAYGRRDLGEVLQPAIGFAENGYVVAPRVALDWQHAAAKLRATNAQSLLVNGDAPHSGSVMRAPALAQTLRRIAKTGPKAFYEGEIAAGIVSELRKRGGVHSEADFATGAAAATFVAPISAAFAGRDVWECPPNGVGVIALMIMAIMDGFAPEPGADSLDPLRLHRHIEAARLAYRDRNAFIADPDHMPVSAAQLLDPSYIDGLRRFIDDERAMRNLPPPGAVGGNTAYVCVVDQDGNACSLINSLFQEFGSGIVAGDTGILMQNRGLGFNLQPGHPNCIGPGKQPMHTIIPSIVTKNGEAEIVFGVMGGQYQPVGQSWVLANMLQYGQDPQTAIDMPRFFPYTGKVEVENGIPAPVRAALRAKGHDIVSDFPIPHGGGQAIRIDAQSGTLIGGSDPRKDGFAMGY